MEKEYNKRFKNKELSNEDFDTAGLWSAIEEDLEKDERKGLLPWWLFGLGGLAVLIFAGFWFADYSPFTMSTEKNSLRQEATEIRESIAPNPGKKQSSEQSASQEASIQKESTDKQESTNSESDKLPENSGRNSINTKATRTEKINVKEVFTEENSTEEKPIDLLPIEERTPEETPVPVFESTKESLTPPKEKAPEYKWSILAFLDTKTLFLPIDEKLLQPNLKLAAEDKKRKKEDPKKYRLYGELYGGINQTLFNFIPNPSDSISARGEAETAFYGTNLGWRGSFAYRGWHLGIGTEYSLRQTEFSYTSNETQILGKPDALVKVVLDVAGNTLRQEFADTSTTAIVSRTVLDYNKYELLHFPLELGYSRNQGAWTYGLSAGPSFNFLIKQEGRTVNGLGSIVDFDKDSTPVVFSPFSLSGRVRASLAYRIFGKVHLSLSPTYEFSTQKTIQEVKTQTFSVNMGLRARF